MRDTAEHSGNTQFLLTDSNKFQKNSYLSKGDWYLL